MKKLLLITIMTSLLILLISFAALAQGSTHSKAPGSWVSSINIQNVGSLTADDIHILFYDTNGTMKLDFLVDPPIPAGGSRSYYVPNDMAGLPSDQYSSVINSSQPLLVVANSSSTTPSTAGSYMGFQNSEIGKTLYFPGLYKNYYGFWSEIVLQNTDANQATINIEFYSQKTGTKILGADIIGATIPGNASRTFAMEDLPNVPSGNANGLISAKVTSTSIDLAGIANIWSNAFNGELANYNGYVSGATTVYAPALYNYYYNFVSSLTVQNLGTENADVKITYSNGTTENTTLTPLQAKEYYQPSNAGLPSGNVNGVFSAKVEALNSKPLAVLVNIEDKSKGLLASYNGPAGTTTKVGCPVILKSFYGWFSAQTVQNVGNATTDIKITYANGQTKTFPSIPANGTVNIVELTSSGSILPDTSSLSADIESTTGQPIVAVVQEDSKSRYSATPGDYLLAYT